MNVYEHISGKAAKQEKQIAILLDPDKCELNALSMLAADAQRSAVDYFFVGGSHISNNLLPTLIKRLKDECDIPVVIFPGDNMHLDQNADAILFLSLISGRNPDLLIGKHVNAAPLIRSYDLEAIPTGYMLIESGKSTAVQYMSGTMPIPADKCDIAQSTAMAGEMLGLKQIFMDAGSGAMNPVSEKMISIVSESVSIPLIVGGGIRTEEKALANCVAGADVVVVGNAVEDDPDHVARLSDAIHSYQKVTSF